MSSATEEYLVSSVMTAPPERLHLLVVEAALRYSRIGREAIIEKKFERAFGSLSKARDCVTEMLTGIRVEPNPQLAERLKGLFLFCHQSLMQGDLQHDPVQIENAIKVLEIHRDTWRELIARLSGQAAAGMGIGPGVSTTGAPNGMTATSTATRPVFTSSTRPQEYSGGIDFTT